VVPTLLKIYGKGRFHVGELHGKNYILDTSELREWIRVLEEPACYGYAEKEILDCVLQDEPFPREASSQTVVSDESPSAFSDQRGTGAGLGLSEVVLQGVLEDETPYSEDSFSPTPASSLIGFPEGSAPLEGHYRVTQACCDHISSLVQGVLDLVKAISSNTSAAAVTMSAASEPVTRSSTNKQIDVEKSPEQKKRLRSTAITTGTQSRLIRVRDAPRYLGMDKNRFNAEVRPNLTEMPIGKQGRAFDRLDLDSWADQYKGRNGRPGKKKGVDKPWDAIKSPVSSTGKVYGTSTKLSEEDAFAKALELATSKKRKDI
jgi:hypothetical protein